jgi:hypothetical protein
MDSRRTTPKALASLALTVNLMFGLYDLAARLLSIENAFHIRNDNELFTPFRDEADELRLPMHANARRLLRIGP